MWQNLFEKYGLFVLGGAIGAIIHRLRKKMTIKKFLASVVISMFVSLCAGISCRHYLKIPEELIYVICGLSGVFSEAILDEIESVIHMLPDALKSKLGVHDNSIDDLEDENIN